MPVLPSHHDEEWLRNLARGQAGAAFFRWWYDRRVKAKVGGSCVLLHTGFDQDLPVEQKRFLAEGDNPPDFCLLRDQGPAVRGNVIASFSINSQAGPYTMRNGALTEGCVGCPEMIRCYEGKSPRLWINATHMRDSQRWEDSLEAPDFRVVVFLRTAARFEKAVEDHGLQGSLRLYLNSGLATVAIPEHRELLGRLDELGYARTKMGASRGRHEPALHWFDSGASFLARNDRSHWPAMVSSRGIGKRPIHCIRLDRGRRENALSTEIRRLVGVVPT